MVKASYERELRMMESQVDDSLVNEEMLNVEQVRRGEVTPLSKPKVFDFNTIKSVLF